MMAGLSMCLYFDSTMLVIHDDDDMHFCVQHGFCIIYEKYINFHCNKRSTLYPVVQLRLITISRNCTTGLLYYHAWDSNAYMYVIYVHWTPKHTK